MKDRQFMVMLGLVVAAGLVMGLIAFRVAGSPSPGVASTAAGNASTAAKPTAPSSSGDVDQPPQPEEQPQVADVDSGEPRTPRVEPPAMNPPSSGDAPGTAAVESPPTDAPQAASGDAVQ